MSKRSANIAAVIACLAWVSVFYVARDLTYGIYSQGAGVFPSAGQIDSGIVAPLVVIVFLSVAGWLANCWNRQFELLAALSIVTIITVLPYFVLLGAGI